MNFLKNLSAPRGVVGIELGKDQVCLAARSQKGEGISHVGVLQPPEGGVVEPDWAELMGQFVDKNGLKKRTCHVVLPASSYQLMLVERPDVPDEELKEAVKWKVKDLISSPIESVVVDVFELPPDANKAGKSMLYVVIADLANIQSVIDAVKEAGLQLACIDIEVLALRNLTLLKASDRASAIVRLRSGSGDVSIYRGGNLYLSRHFNLGFSGGLLEDLPVDTLALEIQRSFDYVERQMGQVPPSNLFICGEGIGPEKITQELKRSLPCPVEFFDLRNDIGMNEDEADEGALQLAVAAIGAAYREGAA